MNLTNKLYGYLSILLSVGLTNSVTPKSKNLQGSDRYNLLPQDCGISYSDRIIGGEEAKLGQYPWLARLGYQLPGCIKRDLYRCGGALINEFYVLTAAHCATDFPSMKCPYTQKTISFVLGSILLGEYDSTTDPDCDDYICAESVQRFKPAKTIIHPNYNNPQYANDIALIRLDKRADLNGWVSNICLPRGRQLSKYYVNELAEVAGWGTTNLTKPRSSKIPMFVKVPILKVHKCLESFTMRLNLSETNQMCAGGEENKDSCAGDSGGPLMYIEAVAGPPRYYAIGLVSFGVKQCGKRNKPAIYTRVAAYMDWIFDNIKA